MRVLKLIGNVALFLLTISAFAQGVKLASGEKGLKIAIEGRGDILIRLHTKQAPKTTARILELVKKKFYDGQRFHRVIKTPRPYLIQAGAPGSRDKDIDSPDLLKEGTNSTVNYEDSGFTNDAEGVVGLAAQPGDRDSGDCQFYILLAPAKFLDGNYTVFGKVIQGLDVLKKIEKGDKIVSVTIVDGG